MIFVLLTFFSLSPFLYSFFLSHTQKKEDINCVPAKYKIPRSLHSMVIVLSLTHSVKWKQWKLFFLFL
jgi:hypothetical protein